MRHKKEIVKIGEHTCILHSEENAKFFIIQPVDSNDTEELERQITYIEDNSQTPFIHIAVRINKWNAELTPWPAPPVFGKVPFGDGAHSTLLYIIEQLIPTLKTQFALELNKSNTILGGYSLAGLFSLWVSYQQNVPFHGIVSASPFCMVYRLVRLCQRPPATSRTRISQPWRQRRENKNKNDVNYQ